VARAWQHIYTSVEQEQSPHDRGGFQTLFHSRSGLTGDEVREMEARLVYFPSDTEPVKRVFATISTGKIMMAQIVHLPEPDRLGRKGRYLAHNLVFEPEEFRRVGSDSFSVFREFPFVTTVAQALEQGDLQTGDIPAASLELGLEPDHGVRAAATWPAQDLQGLTLLALRAHRLADERLVVAFVGEPQEVESALEAAVFAVPSSIRTRCSFDTYFYRCNLVDTYFWAVGLLEPPSNRRLITVNAQTHRLGQAVASQPETAYERWATALTQAQQMEIIGRYRDHAYALCQWLEDRARDDSLIAAAPSEVVDSVFRGNRELVQTSLRRKLAQALPTVLARRVFQHLSTQMKAVDLLNRLRTRFRYPELMEVLYRVYESQGFRAPEQEEVQAIGWLLQRGDHALLRLLHACWTDRHDELHAELQLANEDEYAHFIQAALRHELMRPGALPVPGRGDAFLDLYLAPAGPAGYDLLAVVRALLGAGEVACLSRLIPYVQAQPEQELRNLRRAIAKQPDVPDQFRRAVSDALAALPPARSGLLARILDR
jgi:hypothetical protein